MAASLANNQSLYSDQCCVMHGFSANIAGTCGRVMGSRFWQTPDDEYDLMMNTQVRGVFTILCKSPKPGYLAPPSSIVNISRLYGIKGALLLGPYCTSKHAITGLTEAAVYKAGPGNIRVNAVYP